jgi:hypothetical protein
LNLKLVDTDPLARVDKCEDVMTAAIAKVLSLAFPGSSPGVEILKTVAIFCGVGLLAALCAASYGVDLSFAFF